MIFELNLDINKTEGRFSTIENAIVLRQTDAVAYAIRASLCEDGAALDLTGATVRFYAKRPDGNTIIEQATIVTPGDGTVFYVLPKEFTSAAGNVNEAYFRVTSVGGYSASTENIAFTIKPAAFIEATGGDYAPDIDMVLALLEEQRVNYAGNEDSRKREWGSIIADVTEATGRANSAADKCEAMLDNRYVEYDDLTADAKERISASASAGVPIATDQEIEEAFQNDIAPVIGNNTALKPLSQEEYDWAMTRIFG